MKPLWLQVTMYGGYYNIGKTKISEELVMPYYTQQFKSNNKLSFKKDENIKSSLSSFIIITKTTTN